MISRTCWSLALGLLALGAGTAHADRWGDDDGYGYGRGRPRPGGRGRLEMACERGRGDACVEIGDGYRDGSIYEKNPREALFAYRQGCRGNASKGCYMAGWMLEHGEGCAPNLSEAAALYQRGCQGGQGGACLQLGFMYHDGRGVPRDLRRSAQLHRGACDHGNFEGCNYLGVMTDKGEGVAKNDGRAAALFRKACDGGVAVACANLADSYADGRGVAQDASQANALYQRACDGGHDDACGRQVQAAPPPPPAEVWVPGTIDPDELARVRASMEGNMMERNRIAIARDLAQSGQKFACHQVASLMRTSMSDSARIDIAAALWPLVVDKQNQYKLSAALMYPNSPAALKKKLGAAPAVAAGPAAPAAPPGPDPTVVALEKHAQANAPGQKRVGELLSGSASKHNGFTDFIVNLESGRCYTFVGAGGPGVEALFVYLWGPDKKRAADVKARSPLVAMPYCAQAAGPHKLQGKVNRGAGEFKLALYTR